MSQITKFGVQVLWIATLAAVVLAMWMRAEGVDSLGAFSPFLRMMIRGLLIALPMAGIVFAINHWLGRPWKGSLSLILGSFLALNLLGSIFSCAYFGPRLRTEVARIREMRGCREEDAQGTIRTICVENDQKESFRDPELKAIPEPVRIAVAAAEDRYSATRPTIDFGGVLRAFRDLLFSHRRSGGSDGIQQFVRDIERVPRRRGIAGVPGKLQVLIASIVLDDELSRDESTRLYLSYEIYGFDRGTPIRGISAASRLLFDKTPDQLTISEAILSVVLLNQPGVLFPWRHEGGESDERFIGRRTALLERYRKVVAAAFHSRLIDQQQYDEALSSFGRTLRPQSLAQGELELATEGMIKDEINRRVPDFRDRYLAIDIAANNRVQKGLGDALTAGIAKFANQLPADVRGDITTDIVVLDRDGTLTAWYGLIDQFSSYGSLGKPEAYAKSLGPVIQNIQVKVGGLPAAVALATSCNPCALSLVGQLGPESFAAYLRSRQFHVDGQAFPMLALGAGAEASPRLMAREFRKYSFTKLGVAIEPSPIKRILDKTTGAILFQPAEESVLRPAIASQIRGALLLTALLGTTQKALKTDARLEPVVSKTGTAAFRQRDRNGNVIPGKPWRSAGGSWVAVNTVSNTLVVRVRLASNPVFPADAAPTAAVIAHEVLARLRLINSPKSLKEGISHEFSSPEPNDRPQPSIAPLQRIAHRASKRHGSRAARLQQ
jgi:membrane peptidoglycan carboxypeptidase